MSISASMADQQDLMQTKPIGYLRSVFQYKNGTPRQPSLCSSARGSLEIEKSVFNNPEHALEGLEQFSHAWIVFVFHKNRPGHSKAKVKPPRLNGKRVGVFSTRSPYRPNAVGLTLAKIDRISGATVYFSGIDIVDGTPVLDIKPFIPQYDVPVCRGELYKGDTVSDTECSLDLNDHNVGEPTEDTETTLCDSEEGSTSPSENDNLCEGVVSEKVSCQQTDTINSFEYKGETGISPSGECVKDTHKATVRCGKEFVDKILPPELLFKSGSGIQGEELSLQCVTDDDNRDFTTSSYSLDIHENLQTSTGKGVAGRTMVGDGTSGVAEVRPLNAVVSLDSYSLPAKTLGKEPSDRASLMEGVRHEQTVKNTTKSAIKSSSISNSSVAQWLDAPPVSKIHVSFTPNAESQLQNFVSQTTSSTHSQYSLDFLSGEDEIRSTIMSVLSEDPRSVYRREKCKDALYFFTVDQIHVTCWFDEDRAEVVRLQPLSAVEQLSKR
ncbi:tRNA (adenine(37)-N6)-methyltransferase-like [Littorina saxatilis]|uniref:tRNA (adenine(37)-N6)-methyltransferase-like n=1 Tax=Littorina saxatilis TaxID=31220 RepID=UPI0038B6692F